MAASEQDIRMANEQTAKNFANTASSCQDILESMGYVVLKPGTKAFREYASRPLFANDGGRPRKVAPAPASPIRTPVEQSGTI